MALEAKLIEIPTVCFYNGEKCPMLGLGTWKVSSVRNKITEFYRCYKIKSRFLPMKIKERLMS